jgi:hypothetical protein
MFVLKKLRKWRADRTVIIDFGVLKISNISKIWGGA